MPCSVSRCTHSRATSRTSARPVWASTSTRRRAGRAVSVVTDPPSHPPPPAGPPLSTSARMSSASIAAGPRRSEQEELDVARRPGQRADGDRHRSPPAARPPGRRCAVTASARSARSRTTPPLPTRSLPTSNCGFTISASSPSSRVTDSSGVEHQRERDEGQVADHEVDRLADDVERQLADVGAVVHLDPVVALQRPGELAVADVDRDDLARTRPQQDVGEAAGRGAGVEAALALDAHARGRRTPPGRRRACGRRARRSRPRSGPPARRSPRRWSPRSPAWSRGAPETVTRPAATSSLACSRDRASPRRTSSWSSRSRRGGTVGSGALLVVRRGSGWASRARRSWSCARSKTATCSATGVPRDRCDVGEDLVDGGDAGRRRRAVVPSWSPSRSLGRSSMAASLLGADAGDPARAASCRRGRRASRTRRGGASTRSRPPATSRRRCPSPLDRQPTVVDAARSSRRARPRRPSVRRGTGCGSKSPSSVGRDVRRTQLGRRRHEVLEPAHAGEDEQRRYVDRVRALDVGVEAVADHQRPVTADAADGLLHQRLLRLARHGRLDAGEPGDRLARARRARAPGRRRVGMVMSVLLAT